MCESLYCSQDFVVAKGLFSHLKTNCQNTEESFCAKMLKVILLACIYSKTCITTVTLKGLSVSLSEYSYNIQQLHFLPQAQLRACPTVRGDLPEPQRWNQILVKNTLEH